MATAENTWGRMKRWRRFRLRTLLILFSAICVVCGREANRLHGRARAIELLSRSGLYVKQELPRDDRLPWSLLPEPVYRWSLPWSSHCLSVNDVPWACPKVPRPPAPDAPLEFWRASRDPNAREPTRAERKLLVAAIATLTEVDFVQAPFALDDDDLRALSCLAQLESLQCDTLGLTDAGVACLQKLWKMKWLALDFGSHGIVSIETIAKLGKIPRLRRLSLARLPADTVARIQASMPHIEVEPGTGRRRHLPR